MNVSSLPASASLASLEVHRSAGLLATLRQVILPLPPRASIGDTDASSLDMWSRVSTRMRRDVGVLNAS